MGGQAQASRWIDLDGVVNMRDVGGLRTATGEVVQPHRLIRSDNLQDLPPASVRWLLDEAGVTDIVDLRTGVEVRGEGPGPLTREAVEIHHLSLYPEGAEETGIPDEDDEDAPVGEALDGPPDAAGEEELPWMANRPDPDEAARHHEQFLLQHYLGYLTQRPDNVAEAVRTIAHAPGAVVVHCAAGKDRTGTITALALRVVGVPIADVAADYDATNERLSRILERLRVKSTYADDLADQDETTQRTPAGVMQRLLEHVDERWGSAERYLTEQGWSDADTAALRAKLLDPVG